jgi:predicted nucleic acid-binding protein
MSTAWVVSERFDTSFYVVLAVQMECAFVTADRKLYDALNGSDPDEHPVSGSKVPACTRER